MQPEAPALIVLAQAKFGSQQQENCGALAPVLMSLVGKEPSRFDEIDSLRAIACGLVIWEHTAGFYAKIASSGLWMLEFAHAAQLGPLGVYIFFIISGYVIPRSLREINLNSENRGGSTGESVLKRRWQGVKRFAVRRFWRLYPPFWVALLVSWLGHPTATTRRLYWGATMVPSIGAEPVVAGQFWTLEIELLFYISVALLFIFVGRLTWRVLVPVYLGLVGWLLVRAYMPISPAAFDRGIIYLGLMFYGAVCRSIVEFDFSKLKPRGQPKILRLAVLGLATGLLVLPALSWVHWEVWDGGGFFIRGRAIISAVLIFLFWAILTPARIAWLAHVGRWTYSTYLFHTAIFYGLFLQINGGYGRRFSGLPLPVYVGGIAVIAFAFGALAYRWLEQPSDRLGKRLTRGAR